MSDAAPSTGFKVTKKTAPWFFGIAFGTPRTRERRPRPKVANVVAALKRKGLRSLQRFNQTWPKARYTHTFRGPSILKDITGPFAPPYELPSSVQEEHTAGDHSQATP